MSLTHTTNSWMDMSITTFPHGSDFTYTNSSSLTHTADVWTGVQFQVHEACNLVGATVASAYLTGTTGVWRFELWPLSTTSIGEPDLSGSALATSATFQPDAHLGLWDASFTSPYAASAGQFLCALLVPDSGVDASNKMNFMYRSGANEKHSFPGAMKSTDGGSSWSTENYAYPGIGVRTDKSYHLGGIPCLGTTTQNMSAVGDRVAQAITIPEDENSLTGLEIHCTGFYYTGYATTAGETINFGAWDVNGNDLVTPVTLDHEYLAYQLQYNTGGEFYFKEPLKMVSGGTYYIGWESTSTDTTQISCHRYGKSGAGYTLADTPGNPEKFWPGDSAMNIEAFFWDDSDAATVWEPIFTSHGGGRMCLNPILGEVHGTTTLVQVGVGSDTNALMGTELKTFPGSYFGQDVWQVRCNDAADAAITVFQCEEACDLTGAMAYCKAISGTSPSYKFELFAVDTSAYFTPTGSALATTAAFQGVVGDVTANFTSAYTCTKGQVLCLKLSYDSGTIDGSNYADFLYASSTVRYNLFPMASYWTGSSWYGSNQYYPSMVVHTDLAAGVDFGGVYNIGDGNFYSITADDDRAALRMEIPESENLKFHIDGFRYTGRMENSGGTDLIAAIWDEDGAVLASATIDTHQQNYQMSESYSRDYLFTSTATVSSGDVVYIGFQRVTSQLNVQYAEPNGAAGLKSWPGGDAFYASSWDESAGGPWVDDKAKRLMINPILSSVHGEYLGSEGLYVGGAGSGEHDWTKIRIGTHPGSGNMAEGGSSAMGVGDTFWFGMGFAVTEDCELTAAAFDLISKTSPPLYKMELWPLSTTNQADPDTSGTVLAETANLDLSSATVGRQEHAFTSAYSATKGEKLFILIKYVSGTYNNPNNRIVVAHSCGKLDNPDFPFVSYTDNGGTSWTQDSHECPNFAVVTNKNYDLGMAFAVGNESPHDETGAHILDTTGDRVCNEMTFPSSGNPVELTIEGFRFIGMGPQSGDECRVGIWKSDGTLLGGNVTDPEQAGGYPGTGDGWYEYYFDDDVVVSSGDTVYIGFERISDTFDLTRVQVSDLAYPADLAAAKKGFRVWPFSFNCWMKVWDASDGSPEWKHDTVDPYARLLIDPIINDIQGAGLADCPEESGGSTISGPYMGLIG